MFYGSESILKDIKKKTSASVFVFPHQFKVDHLLKECHIEIMTYPLIAITPTVWRKRQQQ